MEKPDDPFFVSGIPTDPSMMTPEHRAYHNKWLAQRGQPGIDTGQGGNGARGIAEKHNPKKIMIKNVTITGADDSIEPSYLLELSNEYPFVEWGILVSRNNYGDPRWPTREWIFRLLAAAYSAKQPIKLSLHLCGAYVREFLNGNDAFIEDFRGFWGAFDRVQLNTHATTHDMKNSAVHNIVKWFEKEFIFQFDGVNDDHIRRAISLGATNVSLLVDKSHGTGILPSDWPDRKQMPTSNVGYAGGLGPDNLEIEIQKIITAAKKGYDPVFQSPVWIDMETNVRSDGDRLFDLKKVRRCLEISMPFTSYAGRE